LLRNVAVTRVARTYVGIFHGSFDDLAAAVNAGARVAYAKHRAGVGGHMVLTGLGSGIVPARDLLSLQRGLRPARPIVVRPGCPHANRAAAPTCSNGSISKDSKS
jgi:hypothetical protein